MIFDVESKILKCNEVIDRYENECATLSRKLAMAQSLIKMDDEVITGFEDAIERYSSIINYERLKLKLLEDNILDKKKIFLFIYSSHCETEFEFHLNIDLESALKCFLQKHNDFNIYENEISHLKWNDYKNLNTILKAFEFQNNIYLHNIIEISNIWFEGDY